MHAATQGGSSLLRWWHLSRDNSGFSEVSWASSRYFPKDRNPWDALWQEYLASAHS